MQQTLGTHHMENDRLIIFCPIKYSTRRKNNLAIDSVREFGGLLS